MNTTQHSTTNFSSQTDSPQNHDGARFKSKVYVRCCCSSHWHCFYLTWNRCRLHALWRYGRCIVVFFQVKATFSVTLSVFCMVYEIFTMSSTKAISTSSAVVEFHFQIKPMLSVTLALVSEFAMIFELFAVSSIILALFFTVHAVQQGVLLQLFSSKAHVCLISFSVCLRRVLGSQASRPLQSPAVCRAQPTCWHWK